MKQFIILAAGTLVLGFASCKSNKNNSSAASGSQGPQATSEPTVYKGVTDAACAVEVSFGSYGSGIDGPALDKVTALIESKKLASTSKSIGREGERRICLPLTELGKKEKTEFIEQLKKIAKEGQLVSVSIR